MDSMTGSAVFIGPCGEVLNALAARHPDLKILVLEPAIAGCDASVGRDTDARLVVLNGPEYHGSASTIAQNFPALHKAPVFVDAALEERAPAEVARAREALGRLAFQASANDEARRASEGRYLIHTLANAPRLAREADAKDLRSVWSGVPAVIAAAGPSLDRNLLDLDLVKDRAVVIACDTAARPLLNLNLPVDLIVASDPSRANAAHLSSLPPTQAWLVAEASLHPSAFVHSAGRTFFFRVASHHPWPWLRTAGIDVAKIETWGSVATSAFSVALDLGCDPIVFIGADFAFTGGRPYCRGTSFETLWGLWMGGGATPESIWRMLTERWPAEHRQDLNGQETRTARHLVAFRDWIVERAGSISDRRIVNATGAGLLAGDHITQQSVALTLARSPVIDRPALHSLVRGARQIKPERLPHLLRAVDQLVNDRAAQGWEQWRGIDLHRRAIEGALRSPEYIGWRLGREAAA
jgi:hypothetical protein